MLYPEGRGVLCFSPLYTFTRAVVTVMAPVQARASRATLQIGYWSDGYSSFLPDTILIFSL